LVTFVLALAVAMGGGSSAVAGPTAVPGNPTMPTLPAPALSSPAGGITPVCNPSWGTITIPICV
jgi:hypothetical protein